MRVLVFIALYLTTICPTLANSPMFSLSPEVDKLIKSGIECENQSKYDAAISFYRKAILKGAVKQSNGTIYVDMGSCYEKQQKFNEAITNYRLYLKSHKDFSISINIARCYYRLQQYSLSRAELKPLLESQPGNTEVKALYTMANFKIEKVRPAVSTLRSFVETYPDHDAYEYGEAKRILAEISKKPATRSTKPCRR
ncbi:MAG: tetratricopeptide repeat protein [Candidatus Obscuribacterales bacterium]|nr:tetratricopeptide repeat protein [Candidatus Obscuribacterales bacterium]